MTRLRPEEKHEKTMTPLPVRNKDEAERFPRPLLRLEVPDLSSRGSTAFLRAVDPENSLRSAVMTVLGLLYPSATASAQKEAKKEEVPWPGTRSVTLVIDPFQDGVAFTTGKNIDSDHKEIHLMTSYIEHQSAGMVQHEITGVLVHEMVHCWQWAAGGTANGGLVEGMADWVRLRAGLGPAHWKRRNGKDDRWDSGYAITAFFLDWLETTRFGEGSVPRINAALRHGKYDHDSFWTSLFGVSVEHLWSEYVDGPGKLDE